MRIIYTNADGGVSIVTPVDNCGLTLQEIIDRSVPPNTSHAVVEDDELPTDRTYRNAWELHADGRSIIHNMDKAREIHKDLMRRERAKLMPALDIEYQRADERGAAGVSAKDSIASQKQALRDVTDIPEIERASTVEELRAVWPTILGESPLTVLG